MRAQWVCSREQRITLYKRSSIKLTKFKYIKQIHKHKTRFVIKYIPNVLFSSFYYTAEWQAGTCGRKGNDVKSLTVLTEGTHCGSYLLGAFNAFLHQPRWCCPTVDIALPVLHHLHKITTTKPFFLLWLYKGARGAGIAQWLERQTHDWKVVGSYPCRSSGRIFFSMVDFLCWLLFRYPFHPCSST